MQQLTSLLCLTVAGPCAGQVPEGQFGVCLEPCSRRSLASGIKSHKFSHTQCLWCMMFLPSSLSLSRPSFSKHWFLLELTSCLNVSISLPLKLVVFKSYLFSLFNTSLWPEHTFLYTFPETLSNSLLQTVLIHSLCSTNKCFSTQYLPHTFLNTLSYTQQANTLTLYSTPWHTRYIKPF